MDMPKELFLVWTSEVDCDGCGYFEQYFSLAEAVENNEEGTEIFKATVTSIGCFKLLTKVVKAKKRKK